MTVSSTPTLTMTMAATDCTFYYHNLPNSDFQFDYCQQQGLTISDWNNCLKQCCPGMTSYAYSPILYALEVCQTLSESGTPISSFITIPLVCVGGLVVLILLFSIYNHFRSKSQLIHDEEREVTSVEWPEENGNFSNYLHSLKWSSNSKEGLPD